MSTTINAARRLSTAIGLVADAGAGAQLLLVTGAKPTDGGALTSANTVLSASTFGTTIGSASSTGIVLTVGALTQTPASNQTGTPTFGRITTSAGIFVVDVDIASTPGSWNISSPIRAGAAVDFSGGLSLTLS
jgi:hypothetical protein